MPAHPRGRTALRAAPALALLTLLVSCGGGGGGGDDVSGTGTGPSSLLFNESELNDVQLTMSAADWQSILDDSRGDEWRVCTFQWKDRVMPNVGVRPAGESSRSFRPPKMSMRLKFDAFEDKKFLGQEELKLDGFFSDPSMIRDRVSYWVYRFVMPAPRSVHCRLFVNGEFRGLYGVEEVWDDESIRERFGNPIGFLYRIRGEALPADPYEYVGNAIGLYVPSPWDPVTRQEEIDRQHIITFAQTATNAPQNLAQVCDIEALLTYFAVSAVTTNVDGYTGDFEVDDHFQYYRPETGRFFILPWDLDNTWGSNDDPPDRSIYTNLENSVLSAPLENSSTMRSLYRQRIGQVMSLVTPSMVAQRVDFIYDQVRSAAHADTLKTWPSQTFDFNQIYIKQYCVDRYASLAEQIAQP
jgi:spore coat protein H